VPERIGEWIGMADGRRFWPLDPRPGEVDASDIAHSLARTCRFAGRCERFYSVAQHSVLVARLVKGAGVDDRELLLHALLHDAAEAYLGDIIRPVKGALWVERDGYFESFATTEARLLACIRARFGLQELSAEESNLIKAADDVALATEARDLMGDPRWPGLPEPIAEAVVPVPPVPAQRQFEHLLEQLTHTGEPEPSPMRGRRGGAPDPRSSD
jgi:5'-deoxynucleotidase YfbR-like HD superfamily hydrolase